MIFKKYSSITNSYDEEFLQFVREVVPADEKYVVQEKVHGSNSSLVTNGKEVRWAKRTSLVDENEQFYDYKSVLANYAEKTIRCFEYLKKKYDGLKYLHIYGELYGGCYPHPDVPKSNQSAIQKGVYYRPDQEFYAFDVRVAYVDKEGNDKEEILSIHESIGLFLAFGFFYAKTLLEGTLDECLAYSNEFTTHIPEWLGLPPLEDNICEGVVIKPVHTWYLKNGDRVIIKNKNDRWAEKAHKPKRVKAEKQPIEMSEQLFKAAETVSLYITENRLNNVISHIGQVRMPKDMGIVIKNFVKDITDDFQKENKIYLDDADEHLLNKAINTKAIELIKETFLKKK